MPMWSYYGTGTGGMFGGMSWWMIGSSLIWLILAVILVWAVVRWLTSGSRSATPGTPQAQAPQQSALDILKTRYARGEIDTATFQAMRAQLDESPTVPPPTPPLQELVGAGR